MVPPVSDDNFRIIPRNCINCIFGKDARMFSPCIIKQMANLDRRQFLAASNLTQFATDTGLIIDIFKNN